MEDLFFENQVFDGKSSGQYKPARGEYANCTFKHLDLSNSDLSHFEFTDCLFEHCDLSLARLTKTTFSDVRLVNCKLQGVNFEPCNEFLFTIGFDGCILNFSSFYARKMPKTRFTGCSLQEVDFTNADLCGADFSGASLAGAKFENTLLENADFRTAVSYSIDPEKNRVKQAKFSVAGLPGLLDKYNLAISPV